MSNKNTTGPRGASGTTLLTGGGKKHHHDCEEECVELPVVKIKCPWINLQPPAVKFDKCIQVCDGIKLNQDATVPTPAPAIPPVVKCDCDLEGAKCYENISLCVLEGDKVDITYAVTTTVLNEGTVTWRANMDICKLECGKYYAVASQLQYSFDHELDKCAECDYDEDSTVNRWITLEQVDREVYADNSSITVCITGHSELDCKNDWNNAWFRIAVLVGDSEECEENLSIYAATKPVKTTNTGTGFGTLVIEDGDLQFPVSTKENKTKCYTKRVECDDEDPIVNTANLIHVDGDKKTTIGTESTEATIGCSTVVIDDFTVVKTCEVSNDWSVTKVGTLLKPTTGGESCGCTYTIGHWKNFGPDFDGCSCSNGAGIDHWPKNDPNDPNGTVITVGGVVYKNKEICQLLNIGKKGCDSRACKNDTTHLNNLVRQLVGAILNGIKNNKNGVPCYPSAEVSDTIDLANELIKAKYPTGINLSVATCPLVPDLAPEPATTYKDILDDYNNGYKGDPHCGDEQPPQPAPTNLTQKIGSKFFANKRKTFGAKNNLKAPMVDECTKTYAQFTITATNSISDKGCTVTPSVVPHLEGCGSLAYDKEFEWVLKQEGDQIDSGCFTLKAGEVFTADSIKFHWINPANVSDGDEFEFILTWSNEVVGLADCSIIDLGSEGSVSETATATSETSGESSATVTAAASSDNNTQNCAAPVPFLPTDTDTSDCDKLAKGATFIKCGVDTIPYVSDTNVVNTDVKDIITNLYNGTGVSLPLASTVCSPSTTYQFTYVVEFLDCYNCLSNTATISWMDGDTAKSENYTAKVGSGCDVVNNNNPMALSIPNKLPISSTSSVPAKSTGCTACEKNRLERIASANVNTNQQTPAQPKSVAIQSNHVVNATRTINRFGRVGGVGNRTTKNLKKK